MASGWFCVLEFICIQKVVITHLAHIRGSSSFFSCEEDITLIINCMYLYMSYYMKRQLAHKKIDQIKEPYFFFLVCM